MGISTSGLNKAIDDINRNIRDAADDTASALANRGRDIAYRNAPHITGRLRSYIRPQKTGKGEARIISHNPSVYNHHGFSLPLWLHAKSNIIETPYNGTRAGYYGKVSSPQEHLSSGNAKYMEIAYFLMLRIADEEFDKNFDVNASTTTF